MLTDRLMTPTRPAPQNRCGFTLIEVLVVAAVITLLMAILLPALARSRENARAVACRSNLATWGHGMAMYAAQHGGVLPFENRGQELSHGRICWFDALDRYLKADERGKICPTVSRGDPTREESYRMNSKLAETSEEPDKKAYYRPYRKLDTLDRPTQTVLLFDGKVSGAVASFKGRWRQKKDDVSYRHNDTTNLLFTDWHIEHLRKDVLRAKSERNEPVVWQPRDMGEWDPNPQGN